MLKKCIARTLIATVIAACLTYFLTSDLNADLVTSTLCGTSDVEVSDFYNRIRACASIKPIDDDIVLVNIDSILDRYELATLVDEVASRKPRAIGIDVVFRDDKDEFGDIMLIDALKCSCKLVAAQQYLDYDQAPESDLVSRNAPLVLRGVANLTSSAQSDMIREYTPFYGAYRQYPSFAARILSVVDTAAYNRLAGRHGDELIRFQAEEFLVISPAEIAADSSLLTDKIVLVGTVNDIADQHPTPLSNRYPGLMIQANALSMMMKGDFVHPASRLINIILSGLSCLVLAFLYIYLDSAQNLMMRIIPVVWILAIGYAGCLLFIRCGIYVDAPRTMLLAALALLVLDIWCALEPITARLYNKFKNHNQS